MKGVQFVVDEKGERRAVLIDLKKSRRLWEDFIDAAIAEQRDSEPRESLDVVQRKVSGETN